MVEYKNSIISIVVRKDPGIYVFEQESAIGKTRLYGVLKKLREFGENVYLYTFSEYLVKVNLPDRVPDLVLFDRYDMYCYDAAFAEKIHRLRDVGAIVLVDLKSDANVPLHYDAEVKLTMGVKSIEVHGLFV